MPARNHIAVIGRAMAVLEALSRFEGSAELKTIASKTGMGKSTVFRILYTLKELGYVEQHAGESTYRTTAKVFSLARSPAKRPRLTTIVHPWLARLRDELQESAWLAEWRRGIAVLVDVVETPQSPRLSYDVGDRCPLHASALGKAIAAHLPEPELDALLKDDELPQFTRYTIQSAPELQKNLAQTRKRGYAVNNQETVEGAVVFAAPLIVGAGQVVGAISVTAPSAKCPAAQRQRIISEVKRAATSASETLSQVGYRATPFPRIEVAP